MSAESSNQIPIEDYVAGWASSPWSAFAGHRPWDLVSQVPHLVSGLMGRLPMDEYRVAGDVAIHRSAQVEAGAVLKGPLILGPGCRVASGAYLRGGTWLERDCTVGPGSEVKCALVFAGSTFAHFNFIGDAVVGAQVNFEAGSIVANHRNERLDKRIRVRIDGRLHLTDATKFGALVGDACRIGANAVLAPGALLRPQTVIARLALQDDEILGDDSEI